MKLSQWHGANVLPVHNGIYQRKNIYDIYDNCLSYFYWNGKYWEWGGTLSVSDVKRTSKESPFVGIWRGIVKEEK